MKDLGEYLVCPRCREALDKKDGGYFCGSCGASFGTFSGVLDIVGGEPFERPPYYGDLEYLEGMRKISSLHDQHYDAKSLSGKIERYFKAGTMKMVVDPRPPLVDVGCGSGTAFGFLGEHKEIIGLDISKDLLADCAGKFPDANLIRCDIQHSPFVDGVFETMFCLFTLEHVFELDAFLKGMWRMLSPEGRLYVAIPAEGGLLWSCLRLAAHVKYSKTLGINYRKVASMEHCNTACAVESALKKHFLIEKSRLLPFGFGGFNVNFAKIYRLRKRV